MGGALHDEQETGYGQSPIIFKSVDAYGSNCGRATGIGRRSGAQAVIECLGHS